MAFEQNRSVFAGLPVATLQQALTNAQMALIALQTGQQVATLSYGEGNGTKHTQFRATDVGKLTQMIGELQACLGLRDRARSGFRFSY
jgi:hypothetical protein